MRRFHFFALVLGLVVNAGGATADNYLSRPISAHRAISRRRFD